MNKTNNKSLNYFFEHQDAYNRRLPLEIGSIYGDQALWYYISLYKRKISALRPHVIDRNLAINLAREKELIPLIYQNIYYLSKEIVDSDDLRIVENEAGFEVYTMDIGMHYLPVFTFTSEGVFSETTIDFYESFFNADLRESAILSLIRYKNYLIKQGCKLNDEIILRLDLEIDDLFSRREKPNSADLNLMAIQNNYRRRLLAALEIEELYFKNGEITYLNNGQKLTRKNNLGKIVLSDNQLYF